MKNLSLFTTVILIFLYIILSHQQILSLGLTIQSAQTHPMTRLSYMFMHDNPIHLLVNIYSLLCLSFLTDAKAWQFLTAAIIAATMPSDLLADIPILGISVLNYTLTGMLIYRSQRFLLLVAINIAVMSVTLMFVNIASYAHLYGFALGIAVAYLHYVLFSPRYNA